MLNMADLTVSEPIVENEEDGPGSDIQESIGPSENPMGNTQNKDKPDEITEDTVRVLDEEDPSSNNRDKANEDQTEVASNEPDDKKNDETENTNNIVAKDGSKESDNEDSGSDNLCIDDGGLGKDDSALLKDESTSEQISGDTDKSIDPGEQKSDNTSLIPEAGTEKGADSGERLRQEPVDQEVEARDVDVTEIRDGELQDRRKIKKPDNYSPDHDYQKKKPKFGRKRRRSGSTSDIIMTPDGGFGDGGFFGIHKRKDPDPQWLIPFAHGWRREMVLRNTYDETKSTRRAADVYYYAPPDGSRKGKKLRSRVQIENYLREQLVTNISVEMFTFIKERIYEDPAEFIRTAGKSTFGSPRSSPAKSPGAAITPPVMKQKKSPFMKSPLSLKKSAMGLSPHVGIGKVIGDKKVKSPPARSPIKIIFRGNEMSMTTVEGSSTPTNTVNSSPIPMVVTMQPPVVDPRRAVAKKHTHKRMRSGASDPPDNLGLNKKVKLDSVSPGRQPKLCGLDCQGRLGVPPSLHCSVCMCMFHPECVGLSGQMFIEGFVCTSCKMNKSLIGTSASNGNKMTVLFPGPPPLTASTARSGGVVRIGGPPPLKIGPSVGPVQAMRQPPPLRPAPPVTSGIQVIRTTLPQLSGQGITTNTVSLLKNAVAIQNSLSNSLITMAPIVNGGMVSSQGSTPTQTILLKNPNTGLSSVVVQPTVQTCVPHVSSPAPIQVSLPSAVPTDVNGQILALPGNVTNKLNMDKPVSLKVNGQKYIIPPHCLINTNEGAKIYLPPGYLPSNMTGGSSKPVSVDLSTIPGKDDQIINIRSYGSKAKTNDTPAASTPEKVEDPRESVKKAATRMSKRLGKGINPALCHIQQLHVGFDCMLHIFEYLNLKDLLRASAVCKTWHRVATQHCLWKSVNLRGCRVLEWDQAARLFRDMHTQKLDLRGVRHFEDSNRTWHQLTSALGELIHLRHLDLGQCPGTILHAITEKITGLVGLTAEFITDNNQDQWSTNTKLDVGKFSNLKDLEVLKLRGMCGLCLPAFSFSGGLGGLSALTNITTMSLTTLRDVPADEFSFLSSLINMEELELGDCTHWKEETYGQLGHMTKLRSLRLECGVDYTEGGLGPALELLVSLTNLELIKFTISQGLVESLPKVTSLKNFSIWPDTENQAVHVNTNTLRVVSEMSSLKQVHWGIMIDSSSTSSTNNEEGTNSEANKQRDCIPILPDNFDMMSTDESKEEEVNLLLEYLSISQLVDRLSNHLPDTKIRVFKVPVISAPKATKS